MSEIQKNLFFNTKNLSPTIVGLSIREVESSGSTAG